MGETAALLCDWSMCEFSLKKNYFFFGFCVQPTHSKCLEQAFSDSKQCPVCRFDYTVRDELWRRSDRGQRRISQVRDEDGPPISIVEIRRVADARLQAVLDIEAQAAREEAELLAKREQERREQEQLEQLVDLTIEDE